MLQNVERFAASPCSHYSRECFVKAIFDCNTLAVVVGFVVKRLTRKRYVCYPWIVLAHVHLSEEHIMMLAYRWEVLTCTMRIYTELFDCLG